MVTSVQSLSMLHRFNQLKPPTTAYNGVVPCSRRKTWRCGSVQQSVVAGVAGNSGEADIDKQRPVVIVGAGPAGLAAAITFKKRAFQKIIILEELDEESYWDSSKSYPYSMNYRGQKMLKKLDLLEHLKENGRDGTAIDCQLIAPDGSQKQLPPFFPPIIVSKEGIIQEYPPSHPNNPETQSQYRVFRQELSEMLFNKLNTYIHTDNESNNDGSIEFYFNTKISEFSGDKELKLTYQVKDSHPICVSPMLVVGADGKNSYVRETLHEMTDKKKFKLKNVSVLNTGSIIKVIEVPQNFALDKEKKQFANDKTFYLIQPYKQDGLLIWSFAPSKALAKRGVRLLFCRNQNTQNALLKSQTKEELFNAFEEYFPQLPIRDIISPEQAEKFIERRGVLYPKGGYCENMSYIVSHNNDAIENSPTFPFQGVVLIGDAIHHFPPTMAQGVNAALEDVDLLDQLLNKHSTLENVLLEYDKQRSIEAYSLVQLTDCSFYKPPQNYIQDYFNRFDRFVRKVLSSKAPTIFPPAPSFYMHSNNLRYSEVLERINTSNQRYSIYLMLIISFVFFGAWYALVF